MGFWSWLFGKLSEPSAEAPVERSCSQRPSAAGTTTTVLDAAAATGKAEPPWYAPTAESALQPVTPQLPEDADNTVALENLLISHFDGHDLTMPMLHNVVERVLPLLRGTESDLPAVAREIGEDQVLAAAVLRTVNSPLYRGAEKISSVQRAVARLGVRALRALLMHQSLRSAIFDRKGITSRYADILWTRSLASATIMRGLAKFTGMDQEEAYLLGLLHDIGSVIVLRIAQEQEKNGFAEFDDETFEYLCHQSHQEFGELIADAWKLPPELKALIVNHHEYPADDDPLRTQRLMLMLSDMIVGHLGYGMVTNYNLLESPVVQDLGLHRRADYTAWLTNLPDEIDELIAES